MKTDLLLSLFCTFFCYLCSTNASENAEETRQPPEYQRSREYRSLLLKNGMKVVVVSDEKTLKSAASLYVAAGSMNNQPELPGLAHLVEHMIFNGNLKYPEPEEFYKFLTANGGSLTAATGLDYTEYKFDVLPNALNESLDHLVHMIVSPLFLNETIHGEVKIVHSEYMKNFPSEAHRFESVGRTRVKKGHPYGMFTTGNLETLWTNPIKLGINLQNELVQFHAKYYLPNLMTLAIVGKEGLDELEEMVKAHFEKISNSFNSSIPEWNDSPFEGEKDLGIKFEIVPVSDFKYLQLDFPVPGNMVRIFENYSDYLTSLIQHAGENQLFFFLNPKNLVTSLSSESRQEYRYFGMFSISFGLTKEGLEKYSEVVEHFFEFLALIRQEAPQEWFWNEILDTLMLKNRFKPKGDPMSLVSSLAKNLVEHSFENAIEVEKKGYLDVKFSAENIIKMIDLLTPEIMRLTLIGNEFKNRTKFTEPTYSTEYNVEPISRLILQKWKNVKPNPMIEFPKPNPFIPKDFGLKPLQNVEQSAPDVIYKNEISKVWHFQDADYNIPKVLIRAKIFCPFTYNSPLDVGLTYIMAKMINEGLLKTTELAAKVGFDVTVTNGIFGLHVSINGYSSGIDSLLHKVMETIAKFPNRNETEVFQRSKQLYEQTLNREISSSPCSFAGVDKILDELDWTSEEQLAILDDISIESVHRFYERFMSRLNFEWFFYGNILPEEAIQLSNISITNFLDQGTKPTLPSEYRSLLREVEIPEGTSWLHKLRNRGHSISCTHVFFQASEDSASGKLGETNLTNYVMTALLVSLMENPLYVQLRTKEQLGYILGATSPHEVGDVSFLLELYVQGEKDPTFVEKRIDNFLETFMKTVTNSTFEKHKQSMYDKWNARSNGLIDFGTEMWKEIFYGHYKFDRMSNKLDILDGISLDQLKNFYEELIGIKPGKERRFTAYVTSSDEKKEENVEQFEDNSINIADLEDKVLFTTESPEIIEEIISTTESPSEDFDTKKAIQIEVKDLASWKLGLKLLPLPLPAKYFTY